ncbi:hypothetical protein JCM10908_001968 [Rhodotorula pacifica]|uniref:uncharacterized protein n=1 Tax=Rhodotorula pacifica TaxID=1495444 RepID=UPI003177F419
MPRSERRAHPSAEAPSEDAGSRMTLHRLVPRLRLVIDPSRLQPPVNHTARLGLAMIDLWAHPFYAFAGQYRGRSWMVSTRDALSDEYEAILKRCVEIEAKGEAPEVKLRRLAALLAARNFTVIATDLVETATNLEHLRVPALEASDRITYHTWRNNLRLLATANVLGVPRQRGVTADWTATRLALDRVQAGLGAEMQRWYGAYADGLPQLAYEQLSAKQAEAWGAWIPEMRKAVDLVRTSVEGTTTEDEACRTIYAASFVLSHKFGSTTQPPTILPHDLESVHHLVWLLAEHRAATASFSRQGYLPGRPPLTSTTPAHPLPPVPTVPSQPHLEPSPDWHLLPEDLPAGESHPHEHSLPSYDHQHPQFFDTTLPGTATNQFGPPSFIHLLAHAPHGNPLPNTHDANPGAQHEGWTSFLNDERALGCGPRIARRIAKRVYGLDAHAWEQSAQRWR